MAYLPVLDILRAYFEIKEEDREIIINEKMREKIFDLDEEIKGVLPPFQKLLSLKVDDEDFTKLEPKEKRERTFEAFPPCYSSPPQFPNHLLLLLIILYNN